jgi:hypothetical protein
MEDARSCRAKFQRNLYTPRIIEEYHRAIVKKRMSAFLQSNQIDLLVLSKLTTVHLFGYEAIARLGRPCILDLHDDSIEEERAQRELTARLARARHVWGGPAETAFLVWHCLLPPWVWLAGGLRNENSRA